VLVSFNQFYHTFNITAKLQLAGTTRAISGLCNANSARPSLDSAKITKAPSNAFPAKNFCVGDAVFAVRGS
jgi:hypothetical protein